MYSAPTGSARRPLASDDPRQAERGDPDARVSKVQDEVKDVFAIASEFEDVLDDGIVIDFDLDDGPADGHIDIGSRVGPAGVVRFAFIKRLGSPHVPPPGRRDPAARHRR